MHDNGQNNKTTGVQRYKNQANTGSLVLEKSIFSNVFEKDIRRAFIYSKSERLAKVLQLITPAFKDTPALRARVEKVALGLVDAALLPSAESKKALSVELLALSSMLSMARSSGLLSAMNVDVILKEVQALLEEVGMYEEPHLLLEGTPTLSDIARGSRVRHEPARRKAALRETPRVSVPVSPAARQPAKPANDSIGHVKDIPQSNRRDTILSTIQNRGRANIKDISTVIRGVSEKTIQRELAALIEAGLVEKSGERRWSLYSLRGGA